MPIYLDEDVSDDYLQDLIAAYRAGTEAAGGPVEESDQIIIDRLEAEQVKTEAAANRLGRTDARSASEE